MASYLLVGSRFVPRGKAVTADLVRIEMPVRWAGGAPSSHPGRALNAWFYGYLARRQESLADGLHSQVGPKPFSVALVNVRDQADPLRLVVTGCGPLAPHLEALAEDFHSVLLDGHWIERSAEPKIKFDTWGEIASRWLLDTSSPRPVRLDFLTPTTFHSKNRNLPLPVPELVFAGLLQRWQAWATVDLGEGAAQTVAERAALRRHRLWSVMTQMEAKFAGFLGWAEFILIRPEPAYRHLLALLGAFAEYTGVGQKTGMGLGCVRAG